MGYPMAGHIAAAGHEVTVYNRTTARAEAWVAEHGGSHAPTPAAAAAGADIVLSCVGDDPDVLQVALGSDGAIPAMREGAIYIDNSTVSADVARKLAAAGSERGISALDAPVSGGQAGAENGKLTVMVGGAQDTFDAALAVMQCYGARVVHMGEAGTGQQAKMVNQICIAGVLQGLSEGLNFAIEAGLDTDALLEAISGGAAQSWQMVNRGQTMVRNEFDSGLSARLDAQGFADLLRGSRSERVGPAGDRDRRRLLRATPGTRARPLGYQHADPPAPSGVSRPGSGRRSAIYR